MKTEKTKRPVDILVDAQRELHESVQKALEKFSESTGVCVTALRWDVHTALNADGGVAAVEYANVRSDISTGV
jgi:hypothetical protein